MAMAAAHLAHLVGLRPYGRWLIRRAQRTAEEVGDPQLTAYVDWLEALDQHFFGFDQGERVRAVLTGSRRSDTVRSPRSTGLLASVSWNVCRGAAAAEQAAWVAAPAAPGTVRHLPLCAATTLFGDDVVISAAEAVSTANPPPEAMTTAAAATNIHRRDMEIFFTERYFLKMRGRRHLHVADRAAKVRDSVCSGS